jgi:hypothetical protein
MKALSSLAGRWPGAVLVALVLAVWGQSVMFQFVWDDQYFIQELKSIRSLASVPQMFCSLDAQSSYPEGFALFRPLRTLHYAVLFALGGGEVPKPWLFHLANLVWHSAATVLLYHVLALLIRWKGEDSATPERLCRVALIGAAAFAAHPVVSEVVCWAKSLDDLMATTFVLASWYALLRWQPEFASKRFYIWAVICFALAVYSKESAVPFAMFVIPFLFWRAERRLGAALKFSLPFIAVAMVFIVHRHLVIGRTSQTAPLSGSYAQTIVDTLPAASIYARLLAGIPPFCIDYSYMESGHALSSAPVLYGIALLILLLGLCALMLRRNTALVGVGFLWLLLFLLPVSNLIPMMQYCAERFLYLPLIGLVIALTAGGILIQHRRTALTIALSVLVAWAALAWNRSWIWRDSVTLFVQSHLEGPTSARVQDNAIAAVLNLSHMRSVFTPVQRPGKQIDLIALPPRPNQEVNWPGIDKTLQELHTLFPEDATVNSAAAINKALQGRPADAIPYFELAVKQRPNNAAFWNNLAQACEAAGRMGDAENAKRRVALLRADTSGSRSE